MSSESQSASQGPAEEGPNRQTTPGGIAYSFGSNVQAIRVCDEQIAPVADEHDRRVIRQLDERIDELRPEAEMDREKAHMIFHAFRSMFKLSPEQGLLLRRGALTMLVSSLEVLISDLIQLFYYMNPAALPQDRKLTLAELRELGSIEDAERFLASEEADKVLQESGVDGQLNYFSTKLSVNLAPLETERAFLTEIFQRRHLLIHNNGVVNRRYVSRVEDRLVEEYGANEGETLIVTQNYLNNAIDTVYVVGSTLAQLCWRNWDKASTEEADRFIVNETLYSSLIDERFELVDRLAERLGGAKYASEQPKRMATINHAIALRDLGRTDKMEKTLRSMDWSACASEFKIALHALRGEEEDFYALLPRAIISGALEKDYLEEWPLFAPQRGTQRFTEVLERHFPESTSE